MAELNVDSCEGEPEAVERKVHSVPSKHHKRRIRASEVIRSDRIDLLAAANQFVCLMIDRQTPGRETSIPTEDIELTRQESETYDAALALLRDQFNLGCKDDECFEKLLETEQSSESDTFLA